MGNRYTVNPVYIPIAKRNFEEFVGQHEAKFLIKDNGCWIWVGANNNRGYPRVGIGIGNKMAPAHRFFYEKKFGIKITEDKDAHHKCNNKKCVNPDHIEILPHKENCSTDFRKLSDEQEKELVSLFDSGLKIKELAIKYKIDRHTVAKIVKKLRPIKRTLERLLQRAEKI